jgi:outer membrane protein TolC
VRELESLLTVIRSGLDRMSGPARLLPVVGLDMREGLLGAGPGGEFASDNRWDLCIRVRWNLTEFLTAREERRITESRIEQARLTYDDLRGKLTAGVQESRDAILSGREQIGDAADQIKFAAASYRLSNERQKMRAPNATLAEVLLAIHGLDTAHYNYLTAVNAYNKAQIRLLVLLGPAASQAGKDGALPKMRRAEPPHHGPLTVEVHN